MSRLCVANRTNHLKPGTLVTHQTFGVGKVLGEWGRLEVELGKNTRVPYPCPGIYDCEFTVGLDRVLHCCRGEYLQKIAVVQQAVRH
jgi:hypothetical protein